MNSIDQIYTVLYFMDYGKSFGGAANTLLQQIVLMKKLGHRVFVFFSDYYGGEMDEEYKKADVCVIPSTDEPASVSQLEAMSFSLPVICSDANGGACYVEDGITGYHFMDCDQEDLERKLDLLLSDKDKMCDMGAAGYRAVIEKYGFERYYNGIMEIVEKIKTDRKMS